MVITSTAFQQNEFIPSKYTCDGINHNPPLTFSQVPKQTESLVLIVDDPDAVQVVGKVFTHWVMFNIPPATMQILENQEPPNSVPGRNDAGKDAYMGPCPPSGTHHYHFKLYALDELLNIPEGSSKEDVEKAMKNHIIESAELIGLYKKQAK